MIQGVIDRLGKNSFQIKGWALTVVTALFALGAAIDVNQLVIIAVLPTILLWLLDGHYLERERAFRKLHDYVRLLDEEDVDYSMKLSNDDGDLTDWFSAMGAFSIFAFYFTFIISILIVYSMV